MGPQAEFSEEEIRAFLQEADEQIQLLDEDLIRLEREADNTALLNEIFRAAHTLKGSSAMVGLRKMADLTHRMEDVLDRVRKHTLDVTPELVDALLASLDGLKVMVGSTGSGAEGDVDVAPLIAALEAAATGVAAERAAEPLPAAIDADASPRMLAGLAEGLSAYRVRARIDDKSGWLAVRCYQVLDALDCIGEIVASTPSRQEIEAEAAAPAIEVLVLTSAQAETVAEAVSCVDEVQGAEVDAWEPSSGGDGADERHLGDGEHDPERRRIDLGPEARGRPEGTQLEMAAGKIETLQTMRIGVDRLDAIINMVGELAIDRTRVHQIGRTLLSRYRDDDMVQALSDTAAHIVKVVDELQESMMQVRMLPIGLLFNKFPRLVRDLARETGKEVEFTVHGEDTEIDRSVIEKMKDPLVHLLRNAVDHGIEPPEARRQAGKALAGNVKLSAYHDQGQILITLEDDGRGIDPASIRDAAVRKGIISADAASRLSDGECVDLIFEAGLSTASRTTEVSGRGVGMDVVRRQIEALNGIVQLESTPGSGTAFSIRLPLTLATFRGLLVESANTAYAIPLTYVLETVMPEPGTVSTIMGRRVMNLRGHVMPLVHLSTICGSANGAGERPDCEFVVVVRAGDRPVAIAVDVLMDQQEIVVKSLGGYMGQAKGIAGVSILGDGQVVLILDVATLVKAA